MGIVSGAKALSSEMLHTITSLGDSMVVNLLGPLGSVVGARVGGIAFLVASGGRMLTSGFARLLGAVRNAISVGMTIVSTTWRALSTMVSSAVNFVVARVAGGFAFMTSVVRGAASFLAAAVVSTVNAAVRFVVAVVKVVGAAIKAVVDFLLSLLEWKDVVNTHRVFSRMTGKLFDLVRRECASLSLSAKLTQMKSTIDQGINKIPIPDFAIDDIPGGDVLKKAGMVPNLIMKHAGKMIEALASAVAQALGLPVEIIDKLSGLASGLFPTELSSTAIKDSLKRLAGLVIDVADITVKGLFAVLNALVKGMDAVLNTRINIPVLTVLFETIIMPGSTLTLMNVFLVAVAAPYTVVYKLASAGTAPFSDEEIATFDGMADDEIVPAEGADGAVVVSRRSRRSAAVRAVMQKVSVTMKYAGTLLFSLIISVEQLLTFLSRKKLGKGNNHPQVIMYQWWADVFFCIANLFYVPLEWTANLSPIEVGIGVATWLHWVVREAFFNLRVFLTREGSAIPCTIMGGIQFLLTSAVFALKGKLIGGAVETIISFGAFQASLLMADLKSMLSLKRWDLDRKNQGVMASLIAYKVCSFMQGWFMLMMLLFNKP